MIAGLRMPWLDTGVRLAMAGVFLYSGWEKIAAPEAFLTAVENYRLLPAWGARAAALFLPWWEVAAGLALLIPGWARAGAALIQGMISVFVAAVMSAMVRGLDISCGCFGPASHEAGVVTLLIDAAMGSGALWVMLEPARSERGRD